MNISHDPRPLYIDPEFQDLVKRIDSATFEDWDSKTYREERIVQAPSVPPEIHRTEFCVGSRNVRIRVHAPANELPGERGCILWIHGGGHIQSGFNNAISLLDRWCRSMNCTIVAPAYSLSPEHPFPTALDECFEVVNWLGDESDDLGIDVNRIVIAGVSAGGGIAAALLMLLRSYKTPSVRFCGQYLQYPMLDDRMITDSSKWADAPIWPSAANRFGWKCYLSDIEGEVPELAAPARAMDLSDMPPSLLIVGTADIFLDETINYSRNLVKAGIPTDLRIYAGAPHGFMTLKPESRSAVTAVDDVSKWIRERLKPTK